MKQKQKQPPKQQPYDSSIKAILQEDAPGIIARLLEGAKLEEAVNGEVLRPPMRADGAYKIRYKGRKHLLQMEFQASKDPHIAFRALVYHAVLLHTYKLPVLSLIIYLFETDVVQSPLREMSGKQEVLTFHYRVIALWTLDARQYVREHELCMYTLLPAMANADAEVLLQAIDELAEQFKGQETKLAERLLWFSLFLRRSTMVKLPDKQRVEERLDTFQQLLEQDEFVRKQRALGFSLGKAEGKEEGKAEGELAALRLALVEVVKGRFPFLADMARQQVQQVHEVEALRVAIGRMATAADETAARLLLNSLLAS